MTDWSKVMGRPNAARMYQAEQARRSRAAARRPPWWRRRRDVRSPQPYNQAGRGRAAKLLRGQRARTGAGTHWLPGRMY